MALPPIIGNLPIFKIFRGEQTANVKAETPAPANNTGARDTVEISQAAIDKLQTESLRDTTRAREVAEDTRGILAENEDVTLGLPQDFT